MEQKRISDEKITKVRKNNEPSVNATVVQTNVKNKNNNCDSIFAEYFMIITVGFGRELNKSNSLIKFKF